MTDRPRRMRRFGVPRWRWRERWAWYPRWPLAASMRRRAIYIYPVATRRFTGRDTLVRFADGGILIHDASVSISHAERLAMVRPWHRGRLFAS